MNLRLDIQGLRAVAVVSVIIFHIQNKWLPGGFIGVDMFFVISGYLISKALIKQTDADTFTYFDFIINRIKRIVPAYFVMCLVSAFIAIQLFIPNDVEAFLYNLRRGLVFTSNQVYATATDYFGAKSFENPLLHTWSLSIEMQFYIFLPILFMILPKRFYKWILIIGTVLLLFYTQYQLQFDVNKQGVYFSTIARISEFVIGILLNFVPTSYRVSRSIKSILSILGILVLLLSFTFIDEHSTFPGMLAVPACFGTALLIWLEDTKINQVLGTRLVVFIGTISYSLYLWHWPILAFYRYYFAKYNLTLVEVFYLVVIIVVISICSYYYIEEFFRTTKKNRLNIGLAFLSSLLIVTWYFSKIHNQDIQNFQRPYTSANGFDIDKITKRDYFLLGNSKKTDDKILLIGDSHAMVMSGFLDIVGQKNDFNFSTLAINNVVPLEGIEARFVPSSYKKEYLEAIPIANDLISKSRIIVLVKNWSGETAYFRSVVQKLIAKLRTNQHLILISDYPKLDENPVRKYRSVVKKTGFRLEKIKFPIMPYGVQEIIDKNPNVHYLDIKNKQFFKNAPYYNDTLMYYDEGHLNHFGSVQYAKFEGNKTAELINKIKK